MRATLESGAGFSAQIETYPDGCVDVKLFDANGHTIGSAVFDPDPAPAQQVAPVTEVPWPASRAG
jgi:hypothetical protein